MSPLQLHHCEYKLSLLVYSVSAVLTRYRGPALWSQVLVACGLGGKSLLAAGLAILLLHLAGDPLTHEGQSWKLLFLTSGLYALFKNLGILVRSKRHTHNSPSLFSSTNKHTKMIWMLHCIWKMNSMLKGLRKRSGMLSNQVVVGIHFYSISALFMFL